MWEKLSGTGQSTSTSSKTTDGRHMSPFGDHTIRQEKTTRKTSLTWRWHAQAFAQPQLPNDERNDDHRLWLTSESVDSCELLRCFQTSSLALIIRATWTHQNKSLRLLQSCLSLWQSLANECDDRRYKIIMMMIKRFMLDLFDHTYCTHILQCRCLVLGSSAVLTSLPPRSSVSAQGRHH